MGREDKSLQAKAAVIVEECIAVRLRLLTRAVTKIYNHALRPHGLTVSQMNILVAASYLGEAKQQEICQALHLEKSTLSRDVERIRAKGWLESLPDQDGRTNLLRVTSAGRKLLEKSTPAWQQAQKQTKALLGEKEIASLGQAVAAIRSGKPREPG